MLHVLVHFGDWQTNLCDIPFSSRPNSILLKNHSHQCEFNKGNRLIQKPLLSMCIAKVFKIDFLVYCAGPCLTMTYSILQATANDSNRTSSCQRCAHADHFHTDFIKKKKTEHSGRTQLNRDRETSIKRGGQGRQMHTKNIIYKLLTAHWIELLYVCTVSILHTEYSIR